MLLSNILFLFFLLFIHSIQCYRWNIPTAIINTQTVIACGSSIDIYPIFDPVQVIICPYVRIENEKIHLIYMNISFDDHTNQLIIYSKPSLNSPPKILIKFNNNSYLTPVNLTRTLTYYFSFSPELMCRFSLINNETTCFYYPISTKFIHIENHYDDIKQGSLMLSEKTRNHFYIIFLLIIIFIIIICFFAIFIVCTNRSTPSHPTRLDIIIDTQMARQEAAKRPPDPLQDGGVPQQPVLADVKEAHTTTAGDG